MGKSFPFHILEVVVGWVIREFSKNVFMVFLLDCNYAGLYNFKRNKRFKKWYDIFCLEKFTLFYFSRKSFKICADVSSTGNNGCPKSRGHFRVRRERN